MIKNLLFIPGNKLHYLQNVKSLKPDETIIDLEDSIPDLNYNQVVHDLQNIKVNLNYYIRPRLYDDKNTFNLDDLKILIQEGYRKFVLPKISKPEELLDIQKMLFDSEYKLNEFKFILLIENALAIINIENLINCFNTKFAGISIGSYDFCKSLQMKHSLDNLYYARTKVLIYAKAYGIEPIDFASMNISDPDKYCTELQTAMELGYRAKFVIHPWQINKINSFKYYTTKEVKEAKLILEKIEKLGTEFSVFKYKDKVIEKPHLDEIRKIVDWSENNETL